VKKKELSKRLRESLMLSYTAAIFSNFFLSSYSQIAIANTISYHTDDGWCNPSKQGFGKHCFGDFYAPLQFVNSDGPWSGPLSSTPPLPFLILKPFALVDSIFHGRVALSLFLIFSVTALLIPVFHAHHKRIVGAETAITLGFFCILSAPSISLIDRGNILAITFPLIYFYFYNIWNKDYSNASYLAVLFILIKPQLVLLTFILLAEKKFRCTLKIILTSILGILVGFLFYPNDFFSNIRRWIIGTLNYQNYGARGVLEPVNVSISSSIDVVSNIFGSPLNQKAVTFICYILFVVSAHGFVRKYKSRSTGHNYLLVTLFPILFVGTTFQYYLVLLLIPLIFHFIQTPNEIKKYVKNESDAVGRVTIAIFILALTPLALPWSLIGNFIPEGWSNISASWLVLQLGLTILGLILYFLPNKARKEITK